MQSQLGPLGGILQSALGAGPWAAVGAAAVGGAVVIGKALYDIGADFDEMADTIATATGASGKDLDKLVQMGKDIATELPVSFQEAGEAVGKMASKTSLSGKPLKDLTKQVLALSKVTGQDLNQVIESSMRLLGDWGLSGAKAAQGMDKLFKASQETGVPTARLAELMTKFGGPFRTLGFGFTESAALLGKWQKEGVNTELVASGMRIAIGRFAKEGREPGKAMRETIEQIQKFGPGTRSTQLAMETFGQRAGTDMARAILEGRFAIGGLVKDIDKSKTTIGDAEKKTRDFSEQWQIFKNQLAVAVAPAAEKMFAGIGRGMELINQYAPPIIAMLKQELGPAFQSLGQAAQALQPIAEAYMRPMLAILKQIVAATKLFITVISEAVQLVVALLTGDWATAWESAQAIFDAFVDYFRTSWENLQDYLSGIVGLFGTIAGGLGNAIKDGVMNVVDTIVGAVTGAFNAVVGAINGAVGAATGAATAVGNAVKNGVMTVVNTITGLVTNVFTAVVGAIRAAVSTALSAATAVGNAIKNGIMTIVNTVDGLVRSAINAVVQVVRSFVAAARSAGESVGNAVKNGIMSIVNTVDGLVRGAIREAVAAVRAFIDNARSAGEAVGKAIWNGIKAAVKEVKEVGTLVAGYITGAVSAAVSAATSFGSDVGSAIWDAIMGALAGIGDAIRGLIPSAGDLLGGIKGAIPGLGMAPPPPGGAPAAAVPGAPAVTPYAGGAGGLAGPVPLGARLSRAMARAQLARPTIAPGEGLQLKVYIGDRELSQLVRSEVVDVNTGIARTLLAGGGPM